MPFRARMKRAFTRSSSSSSNSSGSLSKAESRGIGDPKIYQPGEEMPRPKYRAPVDKKHKAMLERYSMGSDNKRRKSTSSGGSLYSPMGSRMPSRNNSVSRSPQWWSRKNSTAFEQLAETAQDGADVANVGGSSRRPSKGGHVSHAPTRGNSFSKANGIEHVERAPIRFSASNAYDHTPFSVADLSQALDRSRSIAKPQVETL